MTGPSYQCDGCGAVLQSKDELEKHSGTARRSWTCTYCGTAVPTITAEKLSHHRDGSPTDRRS